MTDAAAALLRTPPSHADESRQTEPYPIQLAAASLPPSPDSEASNHARSARAKRLRSGPVSAEDVAAMDAGELAAFGLELVSQLQLVSLENAKRVQTAPAAARSPLRQRNA
jgi:hypothetical protein